jgi:hypothetical protein
MVLPIHVLQLGECVLVQCRFPKLCGDGFQGLKDHMNEN